MFDRDSLERAFGTPFTTKKKVRDVLGYATYEPIRHFFYGLPHIGSKFATEDVVRRVLEEVVYED